MHYENVRAAAGKRAFNAPSGGKEIPGDRYVPERWTNWLAKLFADGDIEIEAQSAAAKPAPASNQSEALAVEAAPDAPAETATDSSESSRKSKKRRSAGSDDE